MLRGQALTLARGEHVRGGFFAGSRLFFWTAHETWVVDSIGRRPACDRALAGVVGGGVVDGRPLLLDSRAGAVVEVRARGCVATPAEVARRAQGAAPTRLGGWC